MPGSSGLFVLGLVERFPLTNPSQTISSSAMKGNSESDVMLTTTCIACISVINYSCGVSKISVFFFSPSLSPSLSLSFFNTKQDFSPWVETTLSPLQRAASPAKCKVWAELNSLSSLLCQQSKCMSYEKTKQKKSLWPWSEEYV